MTNLPNQQVPGPARFTLEPDPGGGWLWRCECGITIAPPPGEREFHKQILAHNRAHAAIADSSAEVDERGLKPPAGERTGYEGYPIGREVRPA
jgi:hypothetical protein